MKTLRASGSCRSCNKTIWRKWKCLQFDPSVTAEAVFNELMDLILSFFFYWNISIPFNWNTKVFKAWKFDAFESWRTFSAGYRSIFSCVKHLKILKLIPAEYIAKVLYEEMNWACNSQTVLWLFLWSLFRNYSMSLTHQRFSEEWFSLRGKMYL